MFADLDWKNFVLGSVVFVTGFAAMGFATTLDLNKKVFGRWNVGHIFGLSTALIGGFIILNSWGLLTRVKETIEEIPVIGGVTTLVEETVTV